MKNIKISNAVILAAGLGSRLKPLTDEVPKCLTEINGQPIILKTLKALEKNGIRESIIVVGYLSNIIIDVLGSKIGNMKIKYIVNDIYDETNSMYSAWLAREYIENGVLLIEGDTIFDDSIIEKLMSNDVNKSLWVVDKFTSEQNGSMSITNNRGKITEIKIIRQILSEYKSNYYKSCGLLLITPKDGKLFSEWLNEDVEQGNVNIYYDLVIEKHLKEFAIHIMDVQGARWQEIDNYEDLRKTEQIFREIKHLVVLLDGSADNSYDELGMKTPLESAIIPTVDYFTKYGKTGLMKTMLAGLPVGSIVANMGILGYNPLRYYPNGRASFEALAQDIILDDNDIAFRCNLVSIKKGILTDFTSNNIDDLAAQKIINTISSNINGIEIYSGQSYRNLLIVRNAGVNANDIMCYEPHMNIGEPIDKLPMKGKSKEVQELIKSLNNFLVKSQDIISEINKEINSSADGLFLWSPSSTPIMPSFHRKFGIDGAIITGMDFLKGMAISTRMEHRKIQGATGYSDTDLNSKLRGTILSLNNNDFVFVHINAPDEESHSLNVQGKVKILEKIDKEFIAPLKVYLDSNYKDNYRISILPDHYTYASNGKHDDKLVPYTIYGKDIKRDDVKIFSENEIISKSRTIIASYDFMNSFIDMIERD
jgi:2,3-bisphosphoglycerate-independent phosphoglycerate mutase